jgi:dethiobiotin synthetase
LLSPLGEDFDTRDWIAALDAVPIVVVPNRLGAVNQARLVLEALPKPARARALVVLVEQRNPDAAARGNARLLSEWVPSAAVFRLPWVDGTEGVKPARRMTAALKSLADALGKR